MKYIVPHMNAKIDRSSQKGASNLEVGAGAAIRNKVARKCIPEKAASEPLEVETQESLIMM